MAKILHVCNTFDPSADVIRCVNELKKYSKHTHALIVHDEHPLQSLYQFEMADPTTDWEAKGWFEWADAVIYQFMGYECGWKILPNKPVAFRNINIYYRKETDKFWCEPYFSAADLSPYKLLASSHIGAADFLPDCRLLPDLLPVFDDAYLPNTACLEPCISYIKHANELETADFKGIKTLNLLNQPHATVLARRKAEATVVIDNVCDGHAGLAGMEAMSLGLPVIVFNHPKEKESLIEMAPQYPPFIEVCNLAQSIEAAIVYSRDTTERQRALREKTRAWVVKYYNSQRLIEHYWDTFIGELLG